MLYLRRIRSLRLWLTYSPRSVNAVGVTALYLRLLSRSKILTTSFFSSSHKRKTYPGGNLLGLLRTAWFISFVFTPYKAATSQSSSTGCSRNTIIRSSTSVVFTGIKSISLFIRYIVLFPQSSGELSVYTKSTRIK